MQTSKLPPGTAMAYDIHHLHVTVTSCPAYPVDRRLVLYTQKLRVESCNAGQKGRCEHTTASISHHARLQ